MKPSDVEQWVVKVVDQLERGLRVEDDRVECKRELIPDHAKAARRIAGHANQVRQDRILWVIGVDEDANPPVVGRAPSDPDAAGWWTQVQARFDEVAPSPSWVNVPVGDNASVLGIGFDTSRPPYVLRLSTDNPSREVPWREGTYTRSATRFDLLKLLVPLTDRPRLSLLGGYVQVSMDRKDRLTGQPPDILTWLGSARLYIDSLSSIIFPTHRCSGNVTFGNGLSVDFDRMSFNAPSPGAVAEQGQIVVHGSSPIGLDMYGESSLDDANQLAATGQLHAVLRSAGIDPLTVEITAGVAHSDEEVGPNKLAIWDIVPTE
jgi:hypothetical protein